MSSQFTDDELWALYSRLENNARLRNNPRMAQSREFLDTEYRLRCMTGTSVLPAGRGATRLANVSVDRDVLPHPMFAYSPRVLENRRRLIAGLPAVPAVVFEDDDASSVSSDESDTSSESSDEEGDDLHQRRLAVISRTLGDMIIRNPDLFAGWGTGPMPYACVRTLLKLAREAAPAPAAAAAAEDEDPL